MAVTDTSSTPDDFVIVVHAAERIVEVIYPPHPTPDMFDAYQGRLEGVIEGLEGAWMCMVDQRAMPVAPEGLTERIAEFNAWALEHGMKRSARIVQHRLVAKLQANHILQHSGVKEASLHYSREDAWRWLLAEGKKDG
jgi:hypothetical protein